MKAVDKRNIFEEEIFSYQKGKDDKVFIYSSGGINLNMFYPITDNNKNNYWCQYFFSKT